GLPTWTLAAYADPNALSHRPWPPGHMRAVITASYTRAVSEPASSAGQSLTRRASSRLDLLCQFRSTTQTSRRSRACLHCNSPAFCASRTSRQPVRRLSVGQAARTLLTSLAGPWSAANRTMAADRRPTRRHFRPPQQAPDCCVECGERLIDTEHPTRRYCDGRCRTRAYRARLASRGTMLMSSIITRVILPGIGPVCPECFSRGYIAALPLSPKEVYSFGVTEPEAQLDWDVDAARGLIAACPRTAQRLEPNWLECWLGERTTITPEHLE